MPGCGLMQSTTRVKPFICTMPMRLDEGWNQIQFNLSDFTRRAYGEKPCCSTDSFPMRAAHYLSCHIPYMCMVVDLERSDMLSAAVRPSVFAGASAAVNMLLAAAWLQCS